MNPLSLGMQSGQASMQSGPAKLLSYGSDLHGHLIKGRAELQGRVGRTKWKEAASKRATPHGGCSL
jgi:hypothetical protein